METIEITRELLDSIAPCRLVIERESCMTLEGEAFHRDTVTLRHSDNLPMFCEEITVPAGQSYLVTLGDQPGD